MRIAIKTSAAALLLFFGTMLGGSVRAQVASPILFSTSASGCSLDRIDLAAVDAAHGTVSFRASASGQIELTCPVSFTVQPVWAQGLTFGITFYNDHGFDGQENHCAILAAFLRSNLNNVEAGSDIADIGASGRSTTGRQVVSSMTNIPLMDLSTSYYWIWIRLTRDSHTASCNPTLVGAWLGVSNIN
jgi:hypothetical protein